MNENTLEIAALGWFGALGCEVRNVTCALMVVRDANNSIQERT